MKRLYTCIRVLLGILLPLALVSCDDDDKEPVKDLFEVIVNKPVVRMGQKEEVTVNIVLGNGNYTVKSFQTEIATATLAGEQITLKSGSGNGATTVEVTDGEGVTAYISVNVGIFELEVNETEVSIEAGMEKTLIVSMGNFSGNEELSVEVADETIISLVNVDQFRPYYLLKGLKIGQTTVTFTDRLGKKAVVQVSINPISISVSDFAPRVGLNNKVQIEIEKGNGGYLLTPQDDELIAIQQVDDVRFNLIGKKVGVTELFIEDREGQTLTLTVTVAEADKVANLGSNNYLSVPFTCNGEVDGSLKGLNAITYEARFNITSLNGSGDARINTVMGVEQIFLLRIDVHKDGNEQDRYLQLSADRKGSIRFEGSTKIEENTWYNVAVRLDGTKSGEERIALYVNGEKETLQLKNGNPDELKDIDLTSNFFIAQSDNKRRLNGAMSYARVWTQALTDEAIREQSGQLFTDEKEGLVANWLFNNGNGNTKTFVSLAPKSFEAEAANVVSTWLEDPLLKAETE